MLTFVQAVDRQIDNQIDKSSFSLDTVNDNKLYVSYLENM